MKKEQTAGVVLVLAAALGWDAWSFRDDYLFVGQVAVLASAAAGAWIGTQKLRSAGDGKTHRGLQAVGLAMLILVMVYSGRDVVPNALVWFAAAIGWSLLPASIWLERRARRNQVL